MAGGTGGHIFPGIALAQALLRCDIDVDWLGAANSLEAKLIPEQALPFHPIAVRALRGKGLLSLLRGPFMVLRAIWQARALIKKLKPEAVVSFGGFVAGPGGIAAKLCGVPLIVHEANRIPGFTNKVLAKIAHRTLAGFPDSFAAAEYVGNPVREEIAAIPDPETRFANRVGNLRLLMIGGSLGAQALNQTLPAALAKIPSDQRPEVRHQCGAKLLEQTQSEYRKLGLNSDSVVPFISDMAQAYAWADVLICRAGALTLAELNASGSFALLVPFPFAVDDHQTHNAQFLVAKGAAEWCPQNSFSAEFAANWLQKLTREHCLQGATRSRAMAKTDALAACVAAVRAIIDTPIEASAPAPSKENNHAS